MYGEGFSLEGDIVDLGSQHDIVEKSGAWFSYNGERLGQGREQAKQFLKENKAIAEELRQKIFDKLKVGAVAAATDGEISMDDEDELDDAPMAGAPVNAKAGAATAMPKAGESKTVSAMSTATKDSGAKDALKKAADEKKTAAIPSKK
jgi:hypothetical protein